VDPSLPVDPTQQVTSSGSGFIYERCILTNAHVVANAIDIRVRPHGSAKRFAGKVKTYAPDVDLAVVEIEESVADEFWKAFGGGVQVKLSSHLPSLQETVQVLGFPTGGRTICVTEGVVSRIDSIELTPPADSSLVIQIDAAINPGNSGGPVFDKSGNVTGVAFCKDVRGSTDNVGYVIPAEIVRCFFQRVGDNGCGYVLSPSVPYCWHKLENQSLRAAHGVPDGLEGVLLTSVAPAVQSALKEGDVLIRMDGKVISNDGQVFLRGNELIQHRYLLRNKRIDEPTVFTVFRDGDIVQCDPVILEDLPPICPRWPDVDYLPEYIILGALALVPLSQSHYWYKECPSLLKATINRWNKRWPGDREGKEQLVLLVTVFAHDLTFGYKRGWRVVDTYNGTAVTSLGQVRRLWEETQAEVVKARDSRREKEANGEPADKSSLGIFMRLGLEGDDDVVLDAAAAMDAEPYVIKTHAIERRSFIRGDK